MFLKSGMDSNVLFGKYGSLHLSGFKNLNASLTLLFSSLVDSYSIKSKAICSATHIGSFE